MRYSGILMLFFCVFLTACPGNPVKEERDKFSDPETSRSQSDRSMQEMERGSRGL